MGLTGSNSPLVALWMVDMMRLAAAIACVPSGFYLGTKEYLDGVLWCGLTLFICLFSYVLDILYERGLDSRYGVAGSG